MAYRYTRNIKTASRSSTNSVSTSTPRLKLAIKPFVRPPAPPPNLYQDTIHILINALNAILKHEPLYLSRSKVGISYNNDGDKMNSIAGRSTSPKAVIISTEEDGTCGGADAKMETTSCSMVKEIISREELYRMVENLCVHNHSKQLYDDVKQAMQRGCYECICKLLHTLPQFATTKEKQVYITSLPNDDASSIVLVAICNVYKEFMEFVSFVRSIFLYLDRAYCVQNNQSLIVDVGIEYFRQAFAATTASSIIDGSSSDTTDMHALAQTTVHSLLLQIQRERNGEVVDRNLLRSTISMLVSLNLFDPLFLKEFTLSSETFFEKEGFNYIENLSGKQFLHHIQHRIQQGHEMQVSYLGTCADSRILVFLIDRYLFQPHLDVFLSKYLGIFLKEKEDHFGDMKLLCVLVKRIQSLDVLKKSFVAYGKEEGDKIAVDPNLKEVIETLLQFKAHLESLPFFTLYNDVFADSLRIILEHVLNASEARGRLMAELTAKHMDRSLRSAKNMKDNDADSCLDSILSLFRYLNSKDVFEAFYKRDLAKRLLTKKSASVDLEKSLLSKLKAECGTAYTAKMEGMFKDVDLSQDIMLSFNSTTSHSVGLTLNSKLEVQILTTGYWPIYPAIPTLRLPSELQSHIDRFEAFYSGKYQGRRIKWQHALGSCLLTAHFNAGSKELEVSQYQAIILVSCCNTGDGFTISQIMDKTGLDEAEAERTLQSLACGKVGTQVLIRKEHDTPPKKKAKSKPTPVHPKDTFHFASNFTSNLRRIKITSIQRKETSIEREKTHEGVTRDRLYFVDAAIVRIMKARKTMEHQNLKGEVLSQLRFPMEGQSMFKKRIESLIEREYLERADGKIDHYNYLA